MLSKLAKTIVPINEILAKRWSCRAFNSDKQVGREQILALCEAARWAPSCAGAEPWSFIIWDRFADAEKFEQAFSCLDDGNRKWNINIPILIGAFTDTKFSNGSENSWCRFDLGAACMGIYIQAVSMGLMAHPMAGFDKDKIKKEFDIPGQYEPVAMIAVGFQDEPEILDDFNRKRELAERKRKPLEEKFFYNTWANGIFPVQ